MSYEIMKGFGGQAVVIGRDAFGNVMDRVIIPEARVEDAVETILEHNPEAEVCVA